MELTEIYMRQALAQAQKAFDEEEVPVGAVIMHKGEIIGKAHNQIKMLADPTAHAEMIAITQASNHLRNERLNGCELYVTIEPCPMCVGAARLARLDKIVYGASDSKSGACGSAIELTKQGMFNYSLEVVGGILEPDCRRVIQEFFLARRK